MARKPAKKSVPAKKPVKKQPLKKNVSRGTIKKKTPTKNKGGRPSKYRIEFNEQAKNHCSLGATDKQLATFFKVTVYTIDKWKQVHHEFLQSLRDGKKIFDNETVVKALLHRAIGYSHPEEKIFIFKGKIVRATTTKHYPPDSTALIYWLKNRLPEEWRDTPREGSGSEGLVDALAKLADKLPQ